MSDVLHISDYVGAILGLVRDGSDWRLDPLMVTPSGLLSLYESNLLLRLVNARVISRRFSARQGKRGICGIQSPLPVAFHTLGTKC
jgi:hypothetical protein